MFFAFLLILVLIAFAYITIKNNQNERTWDSDTRNSSDKVKVLNQEGAKKASSLRVSSANNTEKVPTVKRNNKPEWKKKGWQKQNGELHGYYRTRYRAFKGIIVLNQVPEYYIFDLPENIKEHEHGNCFPRRGKTDNGEKVHKVHFNKRPPLEDISAGIGKVEGILKDCLKN